MEISKNTQPYFVNIDFGTSDVKVIIRHGTRTEQFGIETFSLPTTRRYVGQDANTIVEPEEHAGLAGGFLGEMQAAHITLTPNFYTERKFPTIVMVCLAKALAVMNAPETCRVWLSFALPASHIGKADVIIKRFEQTFKVSRPKETPRRVTIEKVLIESQPGCVIHDQILTYKAAGSSRVGLSDERGDRLMQDAPLWVFLSGSRTQEQVWFSGSFSEIPKHSSSKFFGTFNLMDDLARMIHAEYGIQLNDFEVMFEAFKTGKFEYRNTEFKTGEMSRELVRTFFTGQDMKDYIEQFLNKQPVFPKTAILAGGTMIYGAESFQATFGGMFRQMFVAQDDSGVPNPIWTVASGLDKFSQLAYAEAME